ncbi:MAG: hypothetical protein ACYSWO_27835 [Planctomycetota bacterium]
MKSICRVGGVAVVSLLLVMLSSVVALAGGAVEFERIDPSYYLTDANSLIDIDGPRDVGAKRRALIRYIWMRKGLPSGKLPDKVEKDITDDRYAELFKANLKQIDKLTIEMDYGLNSIVYHFVPFLDEGYSVMAFSMPLLGMNNQPVVDLDRFGKFHLIKHDHMKLLKSPIRFFIEPIVVAINYGMDDDRVCRG